MKTVEVEIKTDVALTESRECWEPIESSLLNGPRRAQSKVLLTVIQQPSILRRIARVSCKEYVCIL